MAKKLILLLLIIPIVVMIILFAASETVANMVDVHVDGIYIVGDPDNVYLDFDQNETFTFEYVVTPTGAKNKEVYIRTAPYGQETEAKFNIAMEPGKITLTPVSIGSAEITVTTVDNAESAKFVVHVTSTKLQSIDATISNDVLVLGGEEGADTAKITTTFLPKITSNTTLHYKSSDESVVTVSAAGVVRAVGRGAATITVIADANENITDTIDVVVEIEGTMVAPNPKPTTKGEGAITVSFDYPETITEENLSYRVLDANGNEIANPSALLRGKFKMLASDKGQKATFEYEFVDASFVGDVTVEIILEIGNETETLSCTVSKVDTISLDYDKSVIGVSAASKGGFSLYFELIPADIEYTVGQVIISNPELISRAASDINVSVVDGDGRLTLKTLGKAGTVTVSLTIYNAYDLNDYVVFEKTIEIGVTAIEVSEYAKDYGLENLFTVGGYKYIDNNGDGMPDAMIDAAYALTAALNKAELLDGYDYTKNFKWHSSQPDKVTIHEKTGVISYAEGYAPEDNENPPLVEFWVSYTYGDQEIASKARFTVRCVKEGINVYSFSELYHATKAEGHPIVLQDDIDDDFGYLTEAHKEQGILDMVESKLYEKIDTTYDYTYYENIGEGRPQVITLLQFHEDLYGNDHRISAHNVTMQKGLGDNGNKIPAEGALFQGPLNFVKAKLEEGSIRGASVKAQDNICFAIYDNVDVVNARLLGCDLTEEGGQLNLVDLNWVGTTVEILGTNVNIQYSRLTNGRTVLRAFGDDKDAQKEIEFTVSNCILQQAREFLMRVGSNRFVDSANVDNLGDFTSATLPFNLNQEDYDINFSSLPFTSATAYSTTVKQRYSSYSDAVKEVYEDAYINTFVTVKDSVFMDTGIFAIAIDSHFSGSMLQDGQAAVETFLKKPELASKFSSWSNMAKTSYGAKLTLEGQIGLYNWKPLEDVDSSTLIEVSGVREDMSEDEIAMDPIAGLLLRLRLNLQKLVEKAKMKYPQITTMYNGKEYVHAGIAFFGGGKNYSVLEIADGAGGMVDDLASHPLSLTEAGESTLEFAAGPESFYFFICSGATVESGGFSPDAQRKILESEDAYGFVERK